MHLHPPLDTCALVHRHGPAHHNPVLLVRQIYKFYYKCNYLLDESTLERETESQAGENGDDLDGLFNTPHDAPPEYVVMLTAYLDESAEPGQGFNVVGGFLGNDLAWRRAVKAWREGLGNRPSLHMKNLRLGSKPERYRPLLEKLGAVPADCGLTAVCGSVRVSDYADLIQGTAAEVVMSGYALCLWPLAKMILENLGRYERVKFVFAEQNEYAVIREIVLSRIAAVPEYLTPSGRPKLAEWSSVPMSSLLEPADYLCYALLQRELDPHSERSQLCSPILHQKRFWGAHLEKSTARFLFHKMEAVLGGVASLGETGKRGLLHDLRFAHSVLGRQIN